MSATGRSLPRRPARRKIPLAAFGLKKYLDRCGPVSKTSGNEEALAPLWNAGVLSVQHSPAKAIPELLQRPDDGTHSAPVDFHAATSAGTAGRVVLDAGLPLSLDELSAPNSASVVHAGAVSGAGAGR